ncbi:EGF CA and EGF and hEGF domain containing protein [Trichuris trichiura]|uniref:EGF CA and EGF and hEGF domain containing protein n=1 Tax=Trichuris trichiura TaxID=36087 RepID=A0A077YY42_TRITR|nr:EGF CA and EGF and hEGF domain containing protein [Trichuris trichiura]
MAMLPNRHSRGRFARRKSAIRLLMVLCSFAWPTFAFRCPADVNPEFEMSYYDSNSERCITVRDLKRSSGVKNWIISAKDVCSASFPNSTIYSWTELELDSISSQLNDIQSRLGQTVLNGIHISSVSFEQSSKVMNLQMFNYNNRTSTTYRYELIEKAEKHWSVNSSLQLPPEQLMAIFTGKIKPPICLISRLQKGDANRLPRTTAIECNDVNNQVDIAFCEHADLDAYCRKWGKSGECTKCSTGLLGRYCEIGKKQFLSKKLTLSIVLADINECSINGSCGVHGICINTWGSYACSCMKGYTGQLCNITDKAVMVMCLEIDECLLGKPCGDNGVCQKLNNDFICVCKQGYTGPLCQLDVNECLLNHVCPNNAYCTNTNGSYYCACNEGYTGRTCESDVDECANKSICNDRGKCQNTNGSFYCECRKGYTGTLCEKNCSSLAGVCGPHGKCNDTDYGYVCVCQSGYTGSSCEIDVNHCLKGPCINGGTCFSGPYGFWCVCRKGYRGDLCQQDVDECKQHENICGLHGRCINLFGSYKCKCFEGYTGIHCDTAATMSMCDIEICGPLGKCFVQNNNFSCLCATGVTGRLCNKAVSNCWIDNPCGRNGFCRHVGNSFTCKCSYGYTGKLCDQRNVLPIDFCKDTSICNKGICKSDQQGGYYCLCPVGYTGVNCEVAYKPCESQLCSINGVCDKLNETDDISVNNHRCICNAGWTGPRCTEKVDMCKGNDICGINGQCIENAGKLYCQCKAGYSGDHCEEKIKRCLILNPCGNGGVCRTYDHNFRCECFAGFTGELCENALHGKRPVENFPSNPKDDEVPYSDDHKSKGQKRSEKGIAFSYAIIGLVVTISVCLVLLLVGRAATLLRATDKEEETSSP